MYLMDLLNIYRMSYCEVNVPSPQPMLLQNDDKDLAMEKNHTGYHVTNPNTLIVISQTIKRMTDRLKVFTSYR